MNNVDGVRFGIFRTGRLSNDKYHKEYKNAFYTQNPPTLLLNLHSEMS